LEQILEHRVTVLESKFKNLFKDYQVLAKSHQRSRDDIKDNIYALNALTTKMDECCSTEDLVERAVAHKDLAKAIVEIRVVITKLGVVEVLTKSLEAETKAREELKTDVSRLKLYGYMIAGAMIALEFTGAMAKIKHIFI
jgi:hypothetical protein